MGRKLSKLITDSRGRILVILPLLFIIILFYTPLINILLHGISLTFIKEIIYSNYYRKIISFTLYQATLSAILSVIIALPGAYIVTRYDFRGKRVLLSLTSLPFILPSILTVLGFVLLFGNNGIINRFLMNIIGFEKPPLRILYSLKAVLLAHIFYNFPLAIRIISNRWRKIPYELTEASYSLGVGRVKSLFTVTLPYLKSSIATSFTLIFLYCFMSFGIILVLGGGPSLSTIEVEVYRFARVSLNISKAATLAIIESIITILVLRIYLLSEKKEYILPIGRKLTKTFSIRGTILAIIYAIPLILIIIAPLLTIVVNSFLRKRGYTTDVTLSLHWYRSIFGIMVNQFNLTSLKAIGNSLILGLGSVLLSLPISLIVSYTLKKRSRITPLLSLLYFLPMGISSIIIGLSYLNTTSSSSYFLIILSHTVISLPLAIRSINNVYKSIDNSLIEASQSLGVGRFKTFTFIELPLLKSGIITAALFTFALSIGEMNASIMLAPPGFVTIPLAIYQLIGSYNYYGACALGSILLVVSLLSFRVMDGIDK